jgi:hypothetical protein
MDTKSSLKTWYHIFGSDFQQSFDLGGNSEVSNSRGSKEIRVLFAISCLNPSLF